MRYLRTNTACRLTVGPFFDKTDGVTPEIALTVTSCLLSFMIDVANVPTLIIDAAPTASGGSNDMVHVTSDAAGFYDLELTAAQVNYLGRGVLAITDAATHCPVFHEFMVVPAQVYDALFLGTDDLDANLTAAAVDLVWDEVLTGGTHNVQNSAGKRLRKIDAAFEVHSGTAQAGTSTTITLDTGASSTDEIYDGDRCVIVDGTGAEEHGLIKSYNGTTKVATMSKPWVITPDATSEFTLSPADVDVELWNDNTVSGNGDWAAMQSDLDIITDTDGVVIGADAVDLIWDEVLTGATHNVTNSAGKRLRTLAGTIFTDGTAQAGGTNSIQLASGAISVDGLYSRAKVIITAGTGVGQEVIITDSVASTDTVSTTPDWLVQPDATSEYNIVPAQTYGTVRNGGYDNGYVYVDVTNGNAGTVKGVNGTTTHPSSVIADARTIADVENITKFNIGGGGVITLDQAYNHFVFEVVNASLLALNGKDIGGSVFMRTGLTGIALGTDRAVFELCGLVDVTAPLCNFLQCGFVGTTVLSAHDSYLAWNCFENSATMPIIDFDGDNVTATVLELVDYAGRIEIQNMTATDTLVMTGNGHLTLNANCAGGVATIAGDVKITDNSGNVTITRGDIEEIKLVTDQMVFTNANELDVNSVSMNDADILGNGTSGNKWRG